MRPLLVLLALGLAACSDQPKWFQNCGGCGAPVLTPDGGWGAGTCTTQQIGSECSNSGDTCTTTADPCVPGLICTDSDPAAHCQIVP